MTHANAETEPQQPRTRDCIGCGRSYEPTRDWSVFCSKPCRMKHHQRALKRGAPLVQLVLAWTATRHAKPGSEEAEICRFARSEITSIASRFNDEDGAADDGRRGAVEYVRTLMATGLIYADRTRG